MRAYEVTAQDFSVIEGRRTSAREQQLFQAGASHTLDSRHITGHAIDFAPYIGGIRWEWPLFYPVVEAFWLASDALGIPLRWGGVWDRELRQLDRAVLAKEAHDYQQREIARQHSLGIADPHPLADGGHIELPRSAYP